MKNYYHKQNWFDTRFESYITTLSTDITFQNILFDALSGGKRIRPILLLELTDSILQQKTTDLRLAFGIELIHNASLILDDMPMMDNDTVRRDKPTLHHKYNEKIALFTCDFLLNEAFKQIQSYIEFHSNDAESVTNIYKLYHDNLGLNGIIGGQLLDLSPLHQFEINIEEDFKCPTFLTKLNEQKTTTLFNLCFILPYMIHCKPNHPHIPYIKSLSKSFGLIFQIADDIEDLTQDQKRQNETGITCNFCLQIGNQEAFALFKQHMSTVQEMCAHCNINTIVFQEIFQYLEGKVIT